MSKEMLIVPILAGMLALSAPPMSALAAQKSTTKPAVPKAVTCDFAGQITPVHQGLLDYTVRSDASSQTTGNKVTISRRMSIVNRDLALQYLVLNNINNNDLIDVVFSMLEHYECMIPDWLYAKLEGVYLAKYQDQNVARASVIVFEDRETAVYVAQLLMLLSTDELQTKIVDGNFVYYTAQKAYWWSHDNLLIRVAAHTPPPKAYRDGTLQDVPQGVQSCETLDVIGGMKDNCLAYQFWQEVPNDILSSYLAKLPSDAEEIPWPEPGQFAGLSTGNIWPSEDEWMNVQMGCDGTAAWDQVGNPWEEEGKLATRPDDKVKITSVNTDKRWYYLGETVTISASAVSVDGNFGHVIADVNNDIYPHPEFTSVAMQATKCGDWVPYVQRMTGVDIKATGNSTNSIKKPFK